MVRRLLLGRAGTGKTHACLGLLTRALDAGERALLLVPTYSQAEHLRYVLLDRTGGLSAHTIETFSSLAERVTGRRLAALTSAPVRDRTAAAALRECFPEAGDLAGLRAEFLAVVKEIKEQGRPADEVLARARRHFPEGARGRRLFEAYGRYVERLPGGDHEDLLLAARARLEDEIPELALLLVDGFHDFTPVQRDVIERLACGAGETVVTLPLDPDHRTHPIFATAARTAAALPGYREQPLRGNRRAGAGGLAELEARLFTPPSGTVDAPGVEVLVCPSEEDEADRLARLVAASGRPFRDFLLVRRSFADHHAPYRAAFARHGVPLRFYAPEPFGRSAAARVASLWLRSLVRRLDPAELLFLLRSPYFLARPPAVEVDAFAAALRRREPVELPACVRPREEGSLLARLRAELGIADALIENPDGDREIARAAQLFAALREEAAAVEELAPAEAAEAVLRRLPLLRATPHDRRHDCVYAVDALDARQWEKPVVLVAGLTSDAFPRQVRQDLFLRDEERTSLGDERGLRLPLRARKEDEERYLFYVALTRARERLVLSWTAYDEQGTPRPPSPYLEEALAHLHGYARRDIALSEQYAQPQDAVSRSDLLPIVADGLARGLPIAVSLYGMGAVDRRELARPRRLELARARPLPARPPDELVRLSPSSMNRFLRCPYLYLMGRVLAVEPPRERALDPLLRGTIVHEALQVLGDDPDADPGEVFDRLFAEQTAGLRLGLEQEAHRRWMRAAVLRAARDLARAPVEAVEYPVVLERGGARLRGRIDRIDRYPFGRVVVDYKTGNEKLQDSLSFEKVQLDSYLLAVEEPAGALFALLRKGELVGFALPEVVEALGRPRKVESMSREELAARRERMERLLSEVAAEIRAGRLAVAPRDPERCTRGQCDGFDLCRVARGRWLAKAAREERPWD